MRPGQDTKRVAISLVLDTFGDFLASEEDVWLARREVFETEVGKVSVFAYQAFFDYRCVIKFYVRVCHRTRRHIFVGVRGAPFPM